MSELPQSAQKCRSSSFEAMYIFGLPRVKRNVAVAKTTVITATAPFHLWHIRQ